jgi:hypothetical protein
MEERLKNSDPTIEPIIFLLIVKYDTDENNTHPEIRAELYNLILT